MKSEKKLFSIAIIIAIMGSALFISGCATTERNQASPLMSPVQEIFYSRNLGLQGHASAKDLEPLANTRWRVTSMYPQPEKPYTATEFSFNSNGILLESAELPNGTIVTDTHIYRAFGSTLILAKGDRTAFSRFIIEGNTMTINTDASTLTLEKVNK